MHIGMGFLGPHCVLGFPNADMYQHKVLQHEIDVGRFGLCRVSDEDLTAQHCE